MEKKRDSTARSPCQRILKAIRISPVFRVIRRRPVLPDGHESPSLSPQPPTMSRKLTITMAENGKEKNLPVDQSHNNDEVAINKSARIVPAGEPLPLPGRISELEITKPKGQLGREVPEPPKLIGLKPSEATSNIRKEKHNLQVQVGEGTNDKGTVADHIENRFSDYIERAKLKLRTVSNVGGGSTKEKRDPAEKTDDHFTNYINKAKAKLRTTSSIGGRRAVPSK